MEEHTGRQWFLFTDEKEQGPFSETEIRAKLDSCEISTAAFLYTEGMSDWKAIKDIELFSSANHTEMIGDSLTQTDDTPSSVSDQNFYAKRLEEKTHNKARFPFALSLFALFAIVFSLFACGLYFWDEKKGSFDFTFFEQLSAKHTSLKSSESGTLSKNAQNKEEPKGIEVASWDELLKFRRTSNSEHSNPSGFALSNTEFTNNFPTIQGAVGPHVDGELIELVLFPQKNKTLMVYPVAQFFKVPLFNGFFTLGPLNNGSKEFPAGSYKIMAKVNNVFLGEVQVQIGKWPSEPVLAQKMKKIERERLLLSEREKRTIRDRIQKLKVLKNNLKAYSEAPRNQRQNTFSKEWSFQFEKLAIEHHQTLKSPLVFHHIHELILEQLEKLNKLHQEIEDSKLSASLNALTQESLNSVWQELFSQEEKINSSLLAIAPNDRLEISSPGEESVRLKLMEGQ